MAAVGWRVIERASGRRTLLPDAGALTGTELIAIERDGQTMKTLAAALTGGGGGGVSDHGLLTGLADDDHTQYALANGTRGTFEVAGAVSTHVAAPDPHTVYATDAALALHESDLVDAHDASAILFVAGGNIIATDVQAAITELDTEKAAVSHGHVASNVSDFDTAADARVAIHTGDATDAHAASAITNTPAGTIVATTVQAALNELDTDKAAVGHTHTAANVSDFTEAAQDAVGGMVDTSLVYADATPALSRAALTGDVTAGAGSNATTIANDAVTNAKLAPMAANSIKGNNTGVAADAADLTAAQTKALLAIANTDVSGLGALATLGTVNLSTLATGTLQAAQVPALTGDVTTVAGALATTIAADVVTNAKLANVPTATFKGRTTAATGDPEDLTVAQATALLDVATTALKGLAPASGGGTTNFLRADMAWAAPPGGGGGVSDGDKGDVVVSGTGAIYTVESAAGSFALPGDISPASLTANQNDWAPTDWATSSTIRIATDSNARTVTGLTGGADGRLAVILNVGTFDVLFAGESASSVAANRFTSDIHVPAGESAIVRYDATLARWHLSAESTSSVDRNRRFPFFASDFEGSAALTSGQAFTGAAISTGTAAAFGTNVDGNHPGIWRLTSSTTANGGYYVKTAVTSTRIAGGELFECIVRPLNISTTTLRIGFHDSITSADAVDGAYLEVAPSTGVAVFKTASNSTRTTSATVNTWAINTWYRVRISIDRTAANATCTVYAEDGTVLGTQTNSANIPTAAGRETGCGIVATESSTTATAMVDVDYMAKGYTSRGLVR